MDRYGKKQVNIKWRVRGRKFEKIPSCAGYQTRPVPLNTMSNRLELSPRCSIFVLDQREPIGSKVLALPRIPEKETRSGARGELAPDGLPVWEAAILPPTPGHQGMPHRSLASQLLSSRGKNRTWNALPWLCQVTIPRFCPVVSAGYQSGVATPVIFNAILHCKAVARIGLRPHDPKWEGYLITSVKDKLNHLRRPISLYSPCQTPRPGDAFRTLFS